MSSTLANADWSPGAYARFRDFRLRPALDLLNAVDEMGAGDVVDLGCGAGAMAEPLRQRGGGRGLIGVDTSPAMLDKAGRGGAYDALHEADIAAWQPNGRPGLIYSNAALHWVGRHETLMPRLAGILSAGGTLAVQMPHQNKAPSHRVWLTLAEELFPGRAETMGTPGVMAPVKYEEILARLGQFRLWETDYYQRLTAEPGSHPVRRFTESTYARPILATLDPDEKAGIIRRYEDVMQTAYPVRGDGTVLFPFRRMFFTLTRRM